MNTPEDIQNALKEIVQHFDKEDEAVRYRQLLTAKRLKYFWDGFSQVWYSEVAHDWRVWDIVPEGNDNDQAYYDKPVNVFRAYLESIIAALSIIVPPVKCFPDDADNTLDLATAKTGDKIAKLLYRHNNVSLLWLHALFIFCTEGMIACYSYPKKDKKYGTYEEKEYRDDTEEHEYARCPNCGYEMSDQMITPEMAQIKWKLEQEKDKFNPGPDDVEIQNFAQEDMDLCPACMQQVVPLIERETLVVTKLVGVTKLPKSRICMEAYGTLNVKVANYAKLQKDTPYLTYAYETHYSNVVEEYEDLRGQFGKDFRQKMKNTAGSVKDPYGEWARLSNQYRGEYPVNVVTVRHTWLRPSAFNVIHDDECVRKLKKLYPNGCKVTLANDYFAHACNEALDDYWTLSYNPLADFLNHDPLGLLLTSVQEITNDLVSLTLQTVEHGIGQTFADPGVLDFNAYGATSTTPGGVYQAKPKTGQNLSNAFHEMKTASLSPEVNMFASQIQTLGQMVSGALPSLFGGQLAGSETASEYSMSRAQATQRLQNTWKILLTWWKEIFGKAIPMFIEESRSDEHEVDMKDDGSFINTFIYRAEMEGKIGRVEIEANENLPLTWSQQKDVLMELFKNANPELMRILAAPENLPIIRDSLGLTEFYVPGEDDVIKQYDEIKELLNNEPMPNPEAQEFQQSMEMDPDVQENPEIAQQIQQQMPSPELPSVEVDPIFDNHQIEFEICRKWITSEAGRQAKVNNEAGYRNVLLHGKQHFDIMQQQQMALAAGGAPVEKKPKQDGKEAPITGESDVATV